MSQQITKVLVTGGAGYIGSVLVGLLLQRGYCVRVIDNLSFGGHSLLPHWSHHGFEFIKGDIREAADVNCALEGVQAVVHLAAIVGDRACHENPDLARQTNRTASEILCDQAVSRGVQRFVFASTCSNYGVYSSMQGGDAFVDETAPLNPLSLYAELKVGFEQFLLKVSHPGFVPICLRLATAYGLSGRPRFDLTVNEFTRELVLGNMLEVYGEQFWRPYCHTADLARGCLAVLEAEPAVVSHQAFNLGDTAENYQKKRLVELILEQTPTAADNVRYVKRGDDPRNYRVNCDKIKTQVGFAITRRVPDGIREVAAAVRSGVIGDPYNACYRNV